MPNEIGELVVTGNTPGWQEYTGGYVNFVAAYSVGQVAVTWAEATAIQQAEAQVHVAPDADLSDPRTKAMYDAIKEHVANVHFIAEVWTMADPTRQIAFLPDGTGLTGAQVDGLIDKIQFQVTNDASLVNGAQTFPLYQNFPDTTPFTVKINANHANVVSVMGKHALGPGYLIGHEIGHANSHALNFIIKNAGAQTATPNLGLIESSAMSFGRALSPSGSFPTNDELVANGLPQLLPIPAPYNVPTSGNDIIQGQYGNYMIYGGDGVDTITYASGSAVVIDLRPPPVYTPNGLLFIGIENVTGTNGSDVITGDVNANTILGLASGDLLSGFDGSDYVHGNQGADNLNGNRGDDTVVGGQDNDTMLGGQGNDVLFGDAGADQLYGDAGNDMLSGGIGADRFFVHNQAGIDRIADFNRSEGDQIVVQAGSYSVYQSGADVIVDFQNGSYVGIANTSLGTLAPGWII